MAQFTLDELFPGEVEPSLNKTKPRLIKPEELEEIDLESLNIGRTLAAAGFHPDDVTIIEGVTPEARKALREQRQAIAATSPATTTESLRQLGIDPSLVEDDLQKELEDRIVRGLDLAKQYKDTVKARSLESIRLSNIESLPIPKVAKSYLSGAAGSILRGASTLARAVETVGLDIDVADELSREANRVAQTRAIVDPSLLGAVVEGATSSFIDIMTLSKLGAGAKGIAVAVGINSANSAITEGKNAGLKGLELASFAAGQGIIEAGTTLVFNKVFGEGLEGLAQPANGAAKKGILNGLKRLGITTAAELPEEITIEILQSYQSVLQGVDPTALDSENLASKLELIVLSTLLTAGMVQGLNTVTTTGKSTEKGKINDTGQSETIGRSRQNPGDVDVSLEANKDEDSGIDTNEQEQLVETDQGEVDAQAAIKESVPTQGDTTSETSIEQQVETEGTESTIKSVQRTTSQISQDLEAAPNILSPSQLSKLVSEGGEFTPAKLPRRGGRLSREAKNRNREIFSTGTARAKQDLNNLKSIQDDANVGNAKADLLDITQRLVPEDTRDTLVKSINEAGTARQLQSVRGRVQSEVEKVARLNAQDRIKSHGKAVDFNKIPDSIVQQVGKDNITRLKKEVKKPRVNERSSEQLNAVADQLAKLEADVKLAEQIAKDTKHATLNEMSAEILETAKQANVNFDKDLENEGILSTLANQSTLHPEDLMTLMDGGKQGALWKSQYKNLKDASVIQAEFERSLVETLGSTVTGFEDKRLSWSKVHTQTAVEGIQINVSEGQTLDLTKGEAVTLLASLKVQDNRKALVNSGLKLGRTRAKSKVELNEDMLVEIQSQLESDPELNQMAEEVIEYLNSLPKTMYDKAHVEINGFSNILGRYFPLARDAQEKLPSSEFNMVDFMAPVVSQIGASKTRVNNNTPVLIEDIFSMIDRHNKQVSGFAAMAKPLQMANLVLKQPNTIKGLDAQFGKDRRKFLQDRLGAIAKDVLGVRANNSTTNNIVSAALRRVVRGVLGLNPFTTLKQIPSLALSTTSGVSVDSVIRSIPVMNPLSKEGKAVRERMMQSAVAWKRYNRTESSRLTGLLTDPLNASHIEIMNTIDRLSEKAMIPLMEGDKAALAATWNAVELDNPNADFKTIESKWIEAITRSQPVTELVDMNGLMIESKSNVFIKIAFTLFSNQRSQNLNMLRRSLRDFDKNPKEALRNITLLTLIAPMFYVGIDELRRFIFGYNDDKEGEEIFQDFMFEIAKNNLGNVYGGDIAIDAVEAIKRRIKGEKGQQRNRQNIVTGVITELTKGSIDLADSLIGEDEIIKSGPHRGKSKNDRQFKDALKRLSIGITTAFGGPGSVLRTSINVGENLFEDDYSVAFTRRTKLRKLEKNGKLSDVQSEELAALEFSMTKTNLIHKAISEGIISEEDGSSMISKALSDMDTELDSIFKTRAAAITVDEKEEPKDMQSVLSFNKSFGNDIVKLEILNRELNLLTELAENATDKRQFLKDNEDVREAIADKNKLKVLLKSINRLKRIIVKPSTSEDRRVSLRGRVETLIKRANKIGKEDG